MNIEHFTDPLDEEQLKHLEEAIAVIPPKDCGEKEFQALFQIFERFPDNDGYGVFWSIVHYLEACDSYESALIQSVERLPVEFNLLMLNRLMNAGVYEVNGRSILSLLEAVSSNPGLPSGIRNTAYEFIDYQRQQSDLSLE
jgi:hypothetical protein